jgi:signal peptidase I
VREEEAVVRGKDGRWAREAAQVLLASLCAGVLLKTFVVDACRVQSASMEGALLPGDYVIVTKLGYGTLPLSRLLGAALPAPPPASPRVGDVLVFHPPDPEAGRGALYVKRCVAGPGDTVLIDRGALLVNGRRLRVEGEAPADGAEQFGPVVVPRHHYFMMGDNRRNSVDSRHWGPVAAESIVGRAAFVYWSLDPGGRSFWERLASVRPGRLGRLVR